MTTLLDTHFLIWLALGSRRLSEFRWLQRYRPWGISPVSLLEIQYLSEVGRLEVHNPEFTETILGDGRFIVDDHQQRARERGFGQRHLESHTNSHGALLKKRTHEAEDLDGNE